MKFLCPMKLHKFPFDTQSCPIMVESCEFSSEECITILLKLHACIIHFSHLCHVGQCPVQHTQRT